MPALKPSDRHVRLRHALAGLEAGILGALLMLASLMFTSAWVRRSIWTVPDLMSAALYGTHDSGTGFLRTSLAGAALILVIYGTLGSVWGIIWGLISPDRQAPFLASIGALSGLGVYAFFFGYLWPHTRPLIALYAPERPLQFAHLLWGITLARSPRLARNIARVMDDVYDAGEIRTGEVIR